MKATSSLSVAPFCATRRLPPFRFTHCCSTLKIIFFRLLCFQENSESDLKTFVVSCRHWRHPYNLHCFIFYTNSSTASFCISMIVVRSSIFLFFFFTLSEMNGLNILLRKTKMEKNLKLVNKIVHLRAVTRHSRGFELLW